MTQYILIKCGVCFLALSPVWNEKNWKFFINTKKCVWSEGVSYIKRSFWQCQSHWKTTFMICGCCYSSCEILEVSILYKDRLWPDDVLHILYKMYKWTLGEVSQKSHKFIFSLFASKQPDRGIKYSTRNIKNLQYMW